MEKLKPPEMNRIARDMDAWKRIEDKLVDRYGRKIVYDRDFLKAKRDIYHHIRSKHKDKPLNFHEKAEVRVLRGQHRQLLRQLYPNPGVRLLRNLLVFTGNVLILAFKQLLVRKSSTPGITVKRQPLQPQKQKQQYNQSAEQKQGQSQLRKPLLKKSTTKAKAIVRKLPMKARVIMDDTPGKGIKR